MFIDTTTCPGFTIRVLNKSFIAEKPSHRDDIISMVATSFAEGEPFCKFLGITADLLKEHLVEALVDKCIEDELSLVCMDNETGRIVAAMLNEDFYDTMNPDEEASEDLARDLPEAIPIFALLELLDTQLVGEKFGSAAGVKQNEVLHAFMGATSKQYSGRGLASRLRKLTADYAREKGFASVVVEPTNPATQHIWTNKLGGTVEYDVAAKDFMMLDGSKPFANDTHSMERQCTIVMLTL
ncbi:Phosphopantetheine attachment site [Seminavis robusta]|uniref:Phosphopantetheine attachment site n=1 Tax=Seminavis robusta TaxID=568900 RepID=A0A9N8HGQ1_9STRA|nr:Phosphopantetheine attachment site [Seminavis robusta]|eukprot:Sro589_g171840.1 Phosphopantetheine attachment site (240) ;mRNA; r:53215-53934